MLLSVSILLALKEAVNSVRADQGDQDYINLGMVFFGSAQLVITQ